MIPGCCNTLNLGYKMSSLIPTKFRCYSFSHLYSFFFSILFRFGLIMGDMYYFLGNIKT
jgi:hypothetical protein